MMTDISHGLQKPLLDVTAADLRFNIQLAPSAPPPPPPEAEIQLVKAAGWPLRHLEFNNAGDAESNNSGITYQGAHAYVQPSFIIQRSLPPGTDHLS